jgi:hypothetical protein
MRYTLKEMFMCDTYMKSGFARKVRERIQNKFQGVTVLHRRIIHRNVNK